MKLRIFVAFLYFPYFLFSQKTDSLTVDSIPKHSVRKAVILSAIIPASGQFYNFSHTEKGQKGKNNIYWKVPLIYSALGATTYFLIKNQSIQHSLKLEYNNRYVNKNSNLNEEWNKYDSAGIVTLYDFYSRRRDLSILIVGATYIAQLIDAGIEAHFVKFDLSEDLTMNIRPKLYNFNTAGIGISFNFHPENNRLPNIKF